MATTTADRRMIKLAMSAPYLERDEEQALALAWKDNKDQEARNRIAMAHMRLVVSMAGKFRNFGLPLGDLVQEGYIGLLEAAARFEPERQVRFSTYASWWIRQAITRALANHGRLIRLPVHRWELLIKVRRVETRLLQMLGRDPTATEISAALGVDEAKISDLLAIAQAPVSLSMPKGDENETLLGDTLPDEATDLTMDAMLSAIDAQYTRAALDMLTDQEREVLTLRYGLNDGKLRSLSEVGAVVGRTRQRIQQIEAGALQQLRARMEA